MNPDLIKQYFFIGVRWAIPPVAGWLATKTGITTDAATAWIGTTVTIVSYVVAIGWSLANKTKYEAKVNTALDLQPGASKDKLKDVIAAGNGASPLEAK